MQPFKRLLYLVLAVICLPGVSLSQGTATNFNGLFCPLATRPIDGHMSGEAKDTLFTRCSCCVKQDTAKKPVETQATKPKPKAELSRSVASVPKVVSRTDTTVIKRVGEPDSMVVTMHFDTLHVVVENAFLTEGSGAVGVGSTREPAPSVPYQAESSYYSRNKGWIWPVAVGAAVVGAVACAIWCRTINNTNRVIIH